MGSRRKALPRQEAQSSCLKVADSEEREPTGPNSRAEGKQFLSHSFLVVTLILSSGSSGTCLHTQQWVLWESESNELQRVTSLHLIIGPWGHLWALWASQWCANNPCRRQTGLQTGHLLRSVLTTCLTPHTLPREIHRFGQCTHGWWEQHVCWEPR